MEKDQKTVILPQSSYFYELHINIPRNSYSIAVKSNVPLNSDESIIEMAIAHNKFEDEEDRVFVDYVDQITEDEYNDYGYY